ncbi:hypothetical protein HHK36_032239 [Tetracentron sinense]|uniref:Lipoxygenase domain-containing protein n=1 Tax=Tetracentron sinense TaxID=13715 RepID=A0A835CXU9_TETSI|nr:hypothetical protein HHK36_032239 [Tetracentron sinense]
MVTRRILCLFVCVEQSYLPSDTLDGLKRLREKELEILRGTGVGERKTFERMYDYDKYNDLGDPDSKEELARPILGGKEHPYPRRCRTGRDRSDKDLLSEKRGSSVYVPRDEAFSEVKQRTIKTNLISSMLHALRSLHPSIIDNLPSTFTADTLSSMLQELIDNVAFPSFTAIDSLYQGGLPLSTPKNGIFQSFPQRIKNFFKAARDYILQFKTPKMIERDRFSWFRDDEFSRQTLAGLNPYSIQLVTV